MAMQGQDRIAYETGYADGIYGRPSDNPYNIATVPKSYDFYEQGYAEGTGSTIPPRGPAGVQGDDGDAGPQGPPGNNGINGAAGLSFLQGTGVPAGGLGNVSDSYLDTSTGDFYNKTGPTTWTFITNLSDVTVATQVDDTGGSPNIIYKGEATAGELTSAASWRIQQITITTDGGGNDDIAILWADGDTAFDNVYDNRLALSYS